MTLIPNWRRLWRQLWSVRLSLAAAALGAVELALPLFQDVIPRGVFAALSIPVAVAAAAARLVAQKSLQK